MKTRLVCIHLFLFSAFFQLSSFAASADPPSSIVKLTDRNALAFNRSIEIEVFNTGALKRSLTSEKMKGMKKFEKQLSPDDLEKLKKLLEKAEWQQSKKDKVEGLDGSVVTLKYRGQSYSIWSPNAETRERGLVGYQRVVGWLFDQGGLDEYGFLKKKETEVVAKAKKKKSLMEKLTKPFARK